MGTPSSPSENHPEVPPNARAEIADAHYRFAAGLNLRDRPLFESAFSPDGGDADVLWLPSVIAAKAADPIPLSSWRRGHNPSSTREE
jgi:hypothetical protein